MFTIDDNFLASVGYDVTGLSEEKKQQYIAEMTEELNARISDRFLNEIDNEQVDEMHEIQENPDRARSWLAEFHSDYRDRDEFKQVVQVVPEDEAVTFYAVALWMRYAVPGYGEIVQQELEAYHAELVDLRKSVNDVIGA